VKPGRIGTIELHADAPPKPGVGAPCNGCGVCCAVEPCPVALVFLFQRKGRCRALQWQAEAKRYVCGMVTAPQRYSRWLPRILRSAAGRFFASRIAAGSGCDADIEVG
jgi:hypothetical protein